MEDSLNSSPEPTLPALKSVFYNKPSNFDQAFEVSLDESVTRTRTRRSELDLEVTSSETDKVQAFKKTRKSFRESFKVGSDETLVSSELEQSETFAKPQAVFSKKNKSFYDCFDVSYNETALTSQPEPSKSPDECNNVNRKRNLFQKPDETQNITIGNESSVRNSTKENNRSSLEVTRNLRTHSLDGPEADSTTLLPKQNQSKKSTENKNSSSYLEQSSINDDNLNNWMSDQSEEELSAPRVPLVTASPSHTNNKPDMGNGTSFWEEKFNEIMQNAERKSQRVKSGPTTNSPQKRKPFKKIVRNAEIPEDDADKYRPPKLLKPAPFATKKLYNHIIKKLEPKYGIDTVVESENLVSSICDTVKKVTRRKNHQKTLINQLKKEMAKAGLVETTMDFYEFVIKFLPYSFRVKVVPCLQPGTNVVFPPKDVSNPFDKIL